MYRLWLWLFCGIICWEKGTAQAPFPENVHRIVFLGNSITYAGKYIVDIETYFITHYPERHYEFINIGLPSETVSGLSEPGHAGGKFPRPDLHERLARVLALTKPDLVFAGYAMNDGIYMPFDEGRFLRFREGILWLHQEVVRTGALFIHMTPAVYDERNGGHIGYANVMDRYSTWLLQQRDSLGWRVADIYFPMKRYLEDHRRMDSSFAFARDGVHPDSLGHWIMAREILRFLGEKPGEGDAMEVILGGKNRRIFGLVEEKQGLMKDAWLTAAGHKRPGMNEGLPLEEAKAREAEIGKRIRELNK
ncbi:MAG: SGNH/GDSL hydrolase family protein [Chitinophagaceae bacterium]|nr:SGNH/GDSL hydrolase family protein [Chitinophagaceae bacterium]